MYLKKDKSYQILSNQMKKLASSCINLVLEPCLAPTFTEHEHVQDVQVFPFFCHFFCSIYLTLHVSSNHMHLIYLNLSFKKMIEKCKVYEFRWQTIKQQVYIYQSSISFFSGFQSIQLWNPMVSYGFLSKLPIQVGLGAHTICCAIGPQVGWVHYGSAEKKTLKQYGRTW